MLASTRSVSYTHLDVYKRQIEKIAELVKEKKLEGISELRDESDKDGMRIYIEVKRGESAEVVLNNLYLQTPMESVFGINMVALVDGRPQLLNLKQMLEAFVRHRREVVTRRTIFELRKARNRAHILEGLTVALANIDEMICLLYTSPACAGRPAGRLGPSSAVSRRRMHKCLFLRLKRSVRRPRCGTLGVLQNPSESPPVTASPAHAG